MTDVFSTDKRSQIMSRIRGYDTLPEITVRSMVHRMGYRFRIQGHDLPGNPDIVLRKHKKVIFVHGCFWHGHRNCKRAKRPDTHKSFWRDKLDKNMERDKRQQRELRAKGWKLLVVWQCQTIKPIELKRRLERFLANPGHRGD